MLAHKSGLTGKKWHKAWPELELHSVNSIAYRFCLVAAGEYDATLSSSAKSDWDIAAGDLILHEAGGVATSFNGAPFVYNKAAHRHKNVIAAGAGLHRRMIEQINDAYAL
jgi:myo-inositol-1(or 4)-monophosphatase